MDTVRLIVAAGLTVLVTVLLCRKTSLFQNRGKKMVDEAKAAERVVTARLAKAQWLYPDGRNDPGGKRRNNCKGQWRCTYIYDIRGIRREYTTTFIRNYPDELELYYPHGEPEKAMCMAEAVNHPGCAYSLLTVAPLVLLIVFYHALGVII